ncbi:hypothetical protein GBAR_LOCUS12700, partial [Geodia barretti]
MITGTDQSAVVSVGASDTATVTITDNDAGEVEVAAASVGITEGGAAGSVCVVLTGTTGSPTELANPLAVSVESVLNADAGAGDFSLGASVTIPAGTTLPTDGSHCVAVSGTEDTFLEGDEAFDAMITGTDQSAVVSVGASDTATVTITDNDAGEVEVAAASVGITEGGAAGSVCVVLTGTTGSPTELVNPLAVSVESVLNADAGFVDFSLGSSVTIPAGTTLPTDGSHCVAVSGTDDTLLECDEAFGARISGTDKSAVVSVGASDTTTVTITDNDAGEVEVAAASVGITEGGAAGSVCVVLTGTTGSPTELANPLEVSVTSVLNAEAGFVDFSLGSSVTIPAGTTLPTDGSHCVAVSGTDDTLLECDEAFGARISGTDKSAVVSVGASDTTTVTITDNDAGEVEVAAASVGITEGGAAGSVCVVLTGTTGSPTELANPLEVSVTSVLNAEAGFVDFSLGSSVTIPAGTTLPTDGSHCVAVSGTDDTLLECDEAFGARISGTDKSAVVSVGASDTTTVTITDNDAGEVEVAAASVGITEGGAAGSVCVVLTGTTGSPTELANPLEVSVTSVLNAEAGFVDFSLGSSVTIPAGTTLPTDGSHCVAVSGTDDTLLECDEAFGARISGTDKSAVVSVGASDTTTVTITDND